MSKAVIDNFSRKVVTALGGRVAYLCSNPFCRRSTIGPNSVKDKTTLIGKAAHITAAAPGGPRYDSTLTNAQRKDIENGIWLCSNCADLIDKDAKRFTVSILKTWRTDAEYYASAQLNSIASAIRYSRPRIEAVLLFQRGISSNEGLIDQPGPNGIIDIEEVKWLFKDTRTYTLKLINNSSITAINIAVVQTNGIYLSIEDGLPLVNNLRPFEEKDINCQLITSYIMTGPDRAASEDVERGYPKELSQVQLSISYKDEHGQEFQTLTSFTGKQPNNIFK